MSKTVAKAFRVLEAFAESDAPLGVTQLAKDLRMDKATVHRMLEIMVRLGYVARVGFPAKYELTLRLWQLGSRIVAKRSLQRVALPRMRELADMSQETIYLTVTDGREAVYVEKIDSSHSLRASTPVGGRVPLYCGSTGKALLAFLPPETIEAVAANLKPYTRRTIATRARLMREIAEIRANGYAINIDEWRPGIAGIAAPIYDQAGKVIASIGVTGPTGRMPLAVLRRLAPRVVAAAQAISAELGYAPAERLNSPHDHPTPGRPAKVRRRTVFSARAARQPSRTAPRRSRG